MRSLVKWMEQGARRVRRVSVGHIPSLAVLVLLWGSGNVAESATSSSETGNTTVDTRSLNLSGLVISGPTSIPARYDTPYTAMLYYGNAEPEDVSLTCKWHVWGGAIENPEPYLLVWPRMEMNVLFTPIETPYPIYIQATVEKPTGRIQSEPFKVDATAAADLRFDIEFTGGAVQFLRWEDGHFVWRTVAKAVPRQQVSGGYTYQWFIDRQQVGTGSTLDYEIAGRTGIRQIELVATDTQGRIGRAFKFLDFKAPLGLNEPESFIPAISLPTDSRLLGEHGEPFEFDPLKTTNGLLIIAHGLWSSGTESWVTNMAAHVRIVLANQGLPVPNIAIFDWEEMADPSNWAGYDQKHTEAKAEAIRMFGLRELSYLGNAVLDGVYTILADFIMVRPYGQSEGGQTLANWIKAEISRGNISEDAPLHLIGHSAGGFIVGECGTKIGSRFDDIRVTMLDTPFPLDHSLWEFPDPGYLDRYVSSLFGSLEFPSSWGSSFDSANRSYQVLTRSWPCAGPFIPTRSAHGYAHEWYDASIQGAYKGGEGFGQSPFLKPALRRVQLGSSMPEPKPAAAPAGTPVPLSGFSTFGNVAAETNGFILTEGQGTNAGIYASGFSFPAGAYSLRFSFQFLAPGDGDYLTVSLSDSPAIFIGHDLPLTRDEPYEAVASVVNLAGAQGDLVFRLVSRGDSNAIVRIQDVDAITMEDPDQDGLSNADETTRGTDLWNADSDRDGLDDKAEVETYLTDPLVADSDDDGASDGDEVAADTDPKNPNSQFAIKSIQAATNGIPIEWWSRDTRTYRVIRSFTPDFSSYNVVADSLTGAVPSRVYLETPQASTNSATFLGVQVETRP